MVSIGPIRDQMYENDMVSIGPIRDQMYENVLGDADDPPANLGPAASTAISLPAGPAAAITPTGSGSSGAGSPRKTSRGSAATL
jgi:hypothetical protein